MPLLLVLILLHQPMEIGMDEYFDSKNKETEAKRRAGGHEIKRATLDHDSMESDNMEKQKRAKWFMKLRLIALCFILLAALCANSLYYRLYRAHDVEALKELYWYGARDFSGVNLGEADLRGANLMGANLRRAYLYLADLRGADLRGADLRGNLQGADLRGAQLRFAGGANLQGADLRGAYLRKAVLGPDLRGADLRGADLEEADLRGAYLQDANLQDANLRGADLGFVKNLTSKQISECRNIEGIRYVSKEFLIEVKQLYPKLMEWWNEDMVKEFHSDGGWNGRWIEPNKIK